MSEFYNIAGIPVEIKGIDDPYFDYRLSAYQSEKANAGSVIEYSESEKIDVPSGEKAGRDDYRIFLTNNGRYINYDILETPEMVTALVDANEDWSSIKAKLCDVEPYGGASLSVRSFNMIGEIMKYVFAKNNGILFSANSGTGKSTHTGLWEKVFKDNVEIINDDMPAVRKIDGGWKLCGTPWSGKSERNVNRIVPLKAIVFLERGEKNEIRRATSGESVFRIMNQTMLPVYKDIMGLVMDNIGEIISSVDTYVLKCTISEEAPEVVREKIFDEN